MNTVDSDILPVLLFLVKAVTEQDDDRKLPCCDKEAETDIVKPGKRDQSENEVHRGKGDKRNARPTLEYRGDAETYAGNEQHENHRRRYKAFGNV